MNIRITSLVYEEVRGVKPQTLQSMRVLSYSVNIFVAVGPAFRYIQNAS
ncbi:MAG TPA: hypothetical protein VFB14_18390 [Bryobacteraceae bacterium]|nr:hypothetical protein [Bryobacteraceae bacterium]